MKYLLLIITVIYAPAPPPKPAKYNGELIKPGFRFRSWNYQLEVYKIEDDLVYYRSHKYKTTGFSNNPMTKQELLKLLKDCPQIIYDDPN